MANVFISYADADAELANTLKEWIESEFPGLSAFVATHRTDIPLGAQWFGEIRRAIREAECVLALVTPRSLSRPWIWFELGAGWMEDRRVVPLCFEGIDPATLGFPLCAYQGLKLAGPSAMEDLAALLSTWGAPGSNPNAKEAFDLLDGASLSCRWVENGGEPWEKVRIGAHYLVWGGPLEFIHLESKSEVATGQHLKMIPSTLEVVSCIPGIVAEARRNRGYRYLYLSDCRTWRRLLVDDREFPYMVRERQARGTADDPILVTGPTVIACFPTSGTIEHHRSSVEFKTQWDNWKQEVVSLRQEVEELGMPFFSCETDRIHLIHDGQPVDVPNDGFGVLLAKPGVPPVLHRFPSAMAEVVAWIRG